MASAPTSERGPAPTPLLLAATQRPVRGLDAPARHARHRSLTSYLLLPRPKDLGKGWLLVATFGLGALAAGGADAHSALRVLVVWPVLELLIYQARYQWNDIAGFEADQCHPDAATRGRLPGPPARARRHKLLSAAVAAARLLLALGIAAAFASLHLLGLVSVLIVAVFGLAAAYEKAKRLATARSMTTAQSVSRSVLGLWAIVGGGYAIRGLTGLALAVQLSPRPLLAACALVALWGFGISFVTSRWAVESMAFAEVRGRRVVWKAEREQAREHLLALVRWLPDVAEMPIADLRSWKPLRGFLSWRAPWIAAGIVAGAAAAACVGILSRLGAAEMLVTIIAGAGLSAAVVRVPPSWRVVALAAASGTLMIILAACGAGRPVPTVLPWAALLAAQITFLSQSLSSTGRVVRARVASVWERCDAAWQARAEGWRVREP